MNIQSDEYMEPVVFVNDALFLSGTNDPLGNYDVIADPKKARELLFEQNLDESYLNWSDFFSTLISDLILDKDYKNSQKDIMDNSKKLKSDALKDNIRKRKAFLLRKKNGLADNDDYDLFVNEVGDEAIHMLNMVATQRYLKGYQEGTMLEEIFSIFKKGCIPCGINRDRKTLSVFNPIVLKTS
ncbi:hypothetical protein [Pantoea phytobeneficialis]|uniref:Uncharacterized protein n=1 Tax=Pantoea phytobeneficialis TaxID=2052056 RepID=A0AAP9H6Z5_9GAMM|nr:hypothetical protein [Pantoea phytobeneficialis]MDO6409775.1 hypothetical protein [Pantoea phytobeneficialis]QGR07875.1 hypothetical protein CTZ24_16185 [Pantoea phytobeneficialis]